MILKILLNYTFFEPVQTVTTYTLRYKRALGQLLNHFVLQNAISVNVKLNLHLNCKQVELSSFSVLLI